MAIISFGEINKNILYPIIGGLSKLVAEFILYVKEPYFNDHPFILGTLTGFGMFLSKIPFIILKINLRRINNNKKQKKGYNNFIYYNLNEALRDKIFCQKYLLILCASLFDFIQKTMSFAFLDDIINNVWIFDILFLVVFSRIILKTKLYSYQIFSLGIIILLGIIMNIINLINLEKISFISFILAFSIEIIYCLEIVLAKYIMDYKYCSPYEISIFEGIFEIFANIILLIISTNYWKEKDDFFKYIDDFNKSPSSEIILMVISMLSRLFFKLFSLITIKIYTSFHIVILLIIGELMFFFDIFEKEQSKSENNDEIPYIKIVLNIILIFLIFFIFLVFTEFIELNFWGLQKYTKKNI